MDKLINEDLTVNMKKFAERVSFVNQLNISVKQQSVAWLTINRLIWELSKGDHCRDYQSGIENVVNYIVELKEKADRYDNLTKSIS